MMHREEGKTVTITLPAETLAAIDQRITSGMYGSTSEVICKAMRVWQKQEEEHQAHLAHIRQRLEKSAKSGESIPLEEAFQQIKERHLQRVGSFTDEAV